MMQKLRNNPEEDTSRMMPISPQKNQVVRQWPMMSKNNIKTSHMHAYRHILVPYM